MPPERLAMMTSIGDPGEIAGRLAEDKIIQAKPPLFDE